MLKAIEANNPATFDWQQGLFRHQNCAHENSHENSVFGSDSGDLHGDFCGGQAELQKERQEPPDE